MGNQLARTYYKWDAESQNWIFGNQKDFYYHYVDALVPQITGDQLPKSIKLLRNGQIFILRADRTYTLTGQEVR